MRSALVDARVETLLAHDDWSPTPTIERPIARIPGGARVVDVAIARAPCSNADIVVTPAAAALQGLPIAATLRW